VKLLGVVLLGLVRVPLGVVMLGLVELHWVGSTGTEVPLGVVLLGLVRVPLGVVCWDW